MTTRSAKARGAASIVLAATLALGMSGCSFFATQATLIQYEPSDGTAANVGDVKIRNVLAISEDGKNLGITMTLSNSSSEAAEVGFQFTTAAGKKLTQYVQVPGNALVSIGNTAGDELVIRGVDATIGGQFPLFAQYGDNEGKGLMVPVLDGSLKEYADLVPEPDVISTAIPAAKP